VVTWRASFRKRRRCDSGRAYASHPASNHAGGMGCRQWRARELLSENTVIELGPRGKFCFLHCAMELPTCAAQFGWLAGYGGVRGGVPVPSGQRVARFSRSSELDCEIMTTPSLYPPAASRSGFAALWSRARAPSIYLELAREFVIDAPAFAALDDRWTRPIGRPWSRRSYG